MRYRVFSEMVSIYIDIVNNYLYLGKYKLCHARRNIYIIFYKFVCKTCYFLYNHVYVYVAKTKIFSETYNVSSKYNSSCVKS